MSGGGHIVFASPGNCPTSPAQVSGDVVAMKRAVAVEATETQAAQIQLDRTAEEYRALHRERQALLAQWDEAREAMRRCQRKLESFYEYLALTLSTAVL